MFTKTDIDNYFISYRQEHLFLLLLATVALFAAIVLYFVLKKHFYKGLAIALASFAILFFTTSFTEFKRADRLRVVNTYNYDLHPEYLKGKELQRVATVKKTINIELYLSIAIMIAGVVLYFYAAKNIHKKYLQGMAIGIVFMAGIAATTFYVMKNNIEKYESGVVEFTRVIVV